MMNPIEYKQLKAFAAMDGGLLGLIWIAAMACSVGQFKYESLSMVSMILMIGSLIFTVKRERRFAREIREDKGFTFGQAWLYTILMVIFASLLTAIAAYAYFAFLDHGFVSEGYTKFLGQPEVKKILTGLDKGSNLSDMILQQIVIMRPIDWAMNMLTTNIFVGMVFSPFIALISRKKRRL